MVRELVKKRSHGIEIKFYLNDDLISISELDPTQTLLDFLRLKCNLTGTKEGCAEGDCGACTVLIGRINNDKKIVYNTVTSCIVFLPTLAFSHVITVEGLTEKNGQLNLVQQAMIDTSGAQCGFCTPGFIMSLYGLWLNEGKISKQKVVNSLQGNLCRCTGYGPIISAALNLSKKNINSNDKLVLNQKLWIERLLQLRSEENKIPLEISNSFYLPEKLSDLKFLLQDNRQATLVAGATDVALWVNKSFKNITPTIFLGQIQELKNIKIQKEKIIVGSLVTYSDLQVVLPAYFPVLKQYINQIGGDQIRNMGTIGGNIANGSPIGDMAPFLIALGAKMVLESQKKSRKIDVESFFLEYGSQDINSDEFISKFEIPLLKNTDSYFKIYKISKRRYEDITTVSAAFYLEGLQKEDLKLRFAFGGMAGIPKRAQSLERLFKEQLSYPNDDTLLRKTIALDFNPLTDCRGSSNFRLQLAQNLYKKFCLFIFKQIDIDIEKDTQFEV